jgi:hypothetical protein
VDNGNCVDIVYLDFSKAFDKVPHLRLITKLKKYGISGKVLVWIQQWLSNRKQRVVLNDCCSDWKAVCSGVPQGSVLGPQLFIIYINDIDKDVNSKLSKFADDTKVGKIVNNQSQSNELQFDLNILYEWSKKWLMNFNLDKCVCMHIGLNNEGHSYYIGNQKLKVVSEEKDLGVLIDQNFKFSKQCSLAVKKANKMLGLIKRKIKHKSKDIICKLYKSLVRPHLEYCVQLWNPSLKTDIKLLEGVQRRALKMINGFKNLTYADRLIKCKLTSLEKRRVRGDLIHVFKMLKTNTFHTLFTLANSNNLRGNSFKIFKERSKLNIRKNCFSQRVINCWNGLPNNVVCSDSINSFKNNLDKFDYFTENHDC